MPNVILFLCGLPKADQNQPSEISGSTWNQYSLQHSCEHQGETDAAGWAKRPRGTLESLVPTSIRQASCFRTGNPVASLSQGQIHHFITDKGIPWIPTLSLEKSCQAQMFQTKDSGLKPAFFSKTWF